MLQRPRFRTATMRGQAVYPSDSQSAVFLILPCDPPSSLAFEIRDSKLEISILARLSGFRSPVSFFILPS
jgi:hypothetical protein